MSFIHAMSPTKSRLILLDCRLLIFNNNENLDINKAGGGAGGEAGDETILTLDINNYGHSDILNQHYRFMHKPPERGEQDRGVENKLFNTILFLFLI